MGLYISLVVHITHIQPITKERGTRPAFAGETPLPSGLPNNIVNKNRTVVRVIIDNIGGESIMNLSKTRLLAIALTVLCLSSCVAYAAIMITSNQVTITPVQTPELLLAVSNQTPYMGDTVTLTATLSMPLQGISVTFKHVNGTIIDYALTNSGGVATLEYTVISLENLTLEATALV